MKSIKHYVDEINDELESAAEYAEQFIEYRAMGEMALAGKFKEMASDELKHAMNLHSLAMTKIEAVKKVYTAPAEMQRSWDEAHEHYVKEYERIKAMVE